MRFSQGDEVIVKDEWPETLGPAHIRTPHYVRGHKGQVVKYFGAFPNPEDLAFARPAAAIPLYHVAFPLSELWPEGASNDEAVVEIYEHWLERP
jgi:nitrile hydratase